jgi:tetratricopeptide (TPR) repeat protein
MAAGGRRQVEVGAMVLGRSEPECIAVELRRGESLGDFDRAVALYGEAEPLWRSLSESTRTVWSLVGLGNMAWRQGAYDRSEALFEEAMALGRAIGFAWGAAQALHALAGVDLARGDHRRAAARYAESLALAQAHGDELTMVDCLARLATLAYPLGDAERAARLCGITEALGEALGVPLMPATRAEYDRVMTAVRADLGAAAFAAAEAAGRVLPLEEGTIEAMAVAVGTMAGGALVGSSAA